MRIFFGLQLTLKSFFLIIDQTTNCFSPKYLKNCTVYLVRLFFSLIMFHLWFPVFSREKSQLQQKSGTGCHDQDSIWCHLVPQLDQCRNPSHQQFMDTQIGVSDYMKANQLNTKAFKWWSELVQLPAVMCFTASMSPFSAALQSEILGMISILIANKIKPVSVERFSKDIPL